MICAVHKMVLFVACYFVIGFEAMWTVRIVSADPRAESGPVMLFCIKKTSCIYETTIKIKYGI